MEAITLKAPSEARFLSDFMSELPSHCLFDKGVTGCGGTTLEIKSKRHSLILVPTVNLVLNKVHAFPYLAGLYGDITYTEFMGALKKQKPYKKIIATYDALPRLQQWLKDRLYSYFLLVDEYHILFNSYAFRYSAVSEVLRQYTRFSDYCFMTATPLDEQNVLAEVKGLDRVRVEWPNVTRVKAVIEDVFYTTKKLLHIINDAVRNDWNLHIFLNSVNTIRSVVKLIPTDDFRTVCSKNAKQADMKLGGKLHVQSINSEVRKVNFYTATAFEGVDIYDPAGKTVVVSDTNIAQSLVDISTLFIQICGRLRDSRYKDEVTFVINTYNHRYLKHPTEESFNKASAALRAQAVTYGEEFKAFKTAVKMVNLGSYEHSPDYYHSIYIAPVDDRLDFDVNLQNLDRQNYRIVARFFASSLSVVNALNGTEKVEAAHKEEALYREILKAVEQERIMTMPKAICTLYPILEKHGYRTMGKMREVIERCAFKRVSQVGNERVAVYNFVKLLTMVQP